MRKKYFSTLSSAKSDAVFLQEHNVLIHIVQCTRIINLATICKYMYMYVNKLCKYAHTKNSEIPRIMPNCCHNTKSPLKH